MSYNGKMISRVDLKFGWIDFPENWFFFFLTNILSLRFDADRFAWDPKGRSVMFEPGVYQFLFSSWYSLDELKAEH